MAIGADALTVLVVTLQVVGLWLLFEKAGKPGWMALVPVLDLLVLLEILDLSEWWLLWLLVPVVNVICWLLVCQDLSEAFGGGAWLTFGLFVAPWLCMPYLGVSGREFRRPLRRVGRIES